MTPLIKISNSDKYEMVITDVTQDSNEYIPESIIDVEAYYKNNKFKYSETYTINIIQKTTTSDEQVVETIFTDHTSYLDEAYYKFQQDGFYTVHHLILPSLEWLENELQKDESILNTNVGIYVSDCKNIYYYNNGELITKSSNEIILLNTDNTTISKISVDRFSICYLYDCFIYLCKQIFSKINYKCLDKSNLGDLQFKRDFVWMSINVIKYYVELNQLFEAQRILEEINYCGGFCNEQQLSVQQNTGCGCNK